MPHRPSLEDQVDALRDNVIQLGNRKPEPARPARFADVPSWKWIAGLALTGVSTLFVMWMNSISADVKSIAEASQASLTTQQKALSAQGERVAGIESWRSGTDVRLSRIENVTDRIETKLDAALKR